MNIILTNFCNGKCPYCFAADTMYGEKSQNLEDEFSIKDFSLVLDHLYTNNPNQAVRLLGGEPTKHSRLDEILNMIIQKGFKRIIIFSNGIIDNKNKEILKKYLDNISFIWNINPPDIYPEAINKNINDCVKELSTSGSNIGFNIFRTDYNLDFIHKMIDDNPIITRIRIGISHPMGSKSVREQKNAIYIKDYPKVGTIIYDFVTKIISRKGVNYFEEIRLDCGYTPCLWSKEESKVLKSIPIFSYGGCSTEVIDITTDLRINPCFTRNKDQSPVRTLKDFPDANKLIRYTIEQDTISKDFLPIVSSDCELCEDRKDCSGGCSGERIILAKLRIAKGEFILKNPQLPIYEQINTLYEIGTLLIGCHDYKGAIEYLRKANNLIQLSGMREKERDIRIILKRIHDIIKCRE